MSTRANVIVKGHDHKFYLYHHCDGYPEGIGNDLNEFLKTYKFGWSETQIVNDLIKGRCAEDNGYELTNDIHGDIEYLYIIDCEERDFYGLPYIPVYDEKGEFYNYVVGREEIRF